MARAAEKGSQRPAVPPRPHPAPRRPGPRTAMRAAERSSPGPAVHPQPAVRGPGMRTAARAAERGRSSSSSGGGGGSSSSSSHRCRKRRRRSSSSGRSSSDRRRSGWRDQLGQQGGKESRILQVYASARRNLAPGRLSPGGVCTVQRGT